MKTKRTKSNLIEALDRASRTMDSAAINLDLVAKATEAIVGQTKLVERLYNTAEQLRSAADRATVGV